MLRHLPALSLIVALAFACASPTLPLPPPGLISVGVGPNVDHVKISAPCGSAPQNAVMVVVNENSSVPPNQAVAGALTDSCGAWDTVAFAHVNDRLDVWYELNGRISQPTRVIVP
jgi:hypothetical protein